MPGKPKEARQALRETIEAILSDIDLAEPSDFNVRLETILNVVLRAFDDLDQGQMPLAFTPQPTKRQGTQPADERRLQLSAFRYKAALQRRKLTPGAAENVILEAYGVASETLKYWRKKLTEEAPGELEQLIRIDARVEQTHRRMNWPVPGTEEIEKLLKRQGTELAALKGNKSKASQTKGKKKPL